MDVNTSQVSLDNISEVVNAIDIINVTLKTSDANPNSSAHDEINLYLQIRFYLLGFLIPVGLIFNLLSCAVFIQTRMQKSVTVFYFFALACADNFVLLGELLLWLNSSTTKSYILNINFTETVDGVCKFVHFLRYFGRLFSSWLVVAICIERFITVAYPLKSTWSSTPIKAKLVITGLAFGCAILSSPGFFAVGTVPINNHTRCLILSEYRNAYHYWQLTVMTCGELIIPSIIVIIFTVLIIRKLLQARKRHFSVREGQQKHPKHRNDRQPTIALLAVSIAFITLRTLYVIVYPLFLNKKTFFPNLKPWLSLYGLYNMAFVFAVMNYAVNFLLYIVTGKTFRGEFIRFLLCKKSRMGPSWSRTSRSHSITSQSTSLSIRRFSNTDTIRVNQALEDMNETHKNTMINYLPVCQNSQL